MSPTRRRLIITLATLLLVAMVPVAVMAAGGTFTDDDTSIFEADIEWMAANGITSGCGTGLYCPDDNVTRGQMAAFMKRLATKKVVAAATADTAGHATTADSATTAASADTAAKADVATNAGQVDGKSAIEFQPARIDFESADNVQVNANNKFDIASGTVSTTDGSGFLCRAGTFPRADILISASGYISNLVGADATLWLEDADGPILGTVRKVSTSPSPFAMEWMYETVGGGDTFTVVANEGGGDTFTVVDAVISVEVISGTRCKGNPIMILPGEPASSDDPDL